MKARTAIKTGSPGMSDGVAGENAPSLPEASPVGGGETETLAETCRRLAEGRAEDISPAVRCALRMASDSLQALAVMSPRDEE
jgi:hypothetical protein